MHGTYHLIFLYASGSLNLTILEHIALAELCLLELTIKIETMICHSLATFMAVYFITTKPSRGAEEKEACNLSYATYVCPELESRM